MSNIKKSIKLTAELKDALARANRANQESNKQFPSLEKDWEFVLLGLKSEIVEQVQEALEASGMKRADLARKMHVSRAYITKLLNETENFEIETIAKLSVALDRDVALRFIKKSERIVTGPACFFVEDEEQLRKWFGESETSPWEASESDWQRTDMSHGQNKSATVIELKAA